MRRSSMMMKPPKFDGKQRLEEFLLAFENVADYNGWGDGDKAFQLRNCLDGQARQILSYTMKMAYSDVVDKLQKRHGMRNQQERFRTELSC